MTKLADYPLIVFALALFVLWLSARTGSFLLKKQRNLEAGVREDFTVILAATLTLLALIIGFAFSIAISRYDQRKNYEEAEANLSAGPPGGGPRARIGSAPRPRLCQASQKAASRS